ncbi:MAG: amidohydrolase family protein [Planctomycetota bacterium]|jgi:cytosine/adenosine deaminase-related metal-dependent hydrolase
MATKPLLLRARTVVPDPASAIEDGGVLIHGDRIARVGRWKGDLEYEPARVLDLGEVALLPGLVNAHAHLDLTGARGRFEPTDDFLSWLMKIKPMRAELKDGVAGHAEEGARELLSDGCTLVADMVAEPLALEGIRRSGIRCVAYIEVIGFPGVVVRPLGDALDRCDEMEDIAAVSGGLAPHTPYTCTPELLQRCAMESRVRGLPLSIHVAETAYELDWLRDGSGLFSEPLAPFFEEGWKAPGRTSVDYLQSLGVLDQPRLLAHGNFLEPAEMDLLRRGGSSIAHCPGSHAFFGHDRHPVTALRDAGVTVALGTDGLVSHPDHRLSMTGELRRLADREPALEPRDLLAMATTAGAAALGLAGRAGALTRDAWADLAAFSVTGGWKGPESILDPDLRCTSTWVGGARRHSA